MACNVSFQSDPKLPCQKAQSTILARLLAKEIVAFSELHTAEIGLHSKRFGRESFLGFPTMTQLLSSVQLWRHWFLGTSDARGWWRCGNLTAGHVCLNLSHIKYVIKEHNKRALNYTNWGDARERWLLIACGSGEVNTQAAPDFRSLKWDDSELTTLCDKSPFDRIVVSDPWRQNHKWLKA
jgi:hypothetical protein